MRRLEPDAADFTEISLLLRKQRAWEQLRSLVAKCCRAIVVASIGTAGPAHMPVRIQTAIAREQQKGEILIGWIQAAVVLAWSVLYATSRKTSPADALFEPVPWTLGFYAVFTAVRIWLAHRHRLGDRLVAFSVVVDIAVLMLLIWSFHLQYRQPAAFYLKAPTLLYVFIFITLRTLRFEARWVLLAGATGAVGWLVLLLYAVAAQWYQDPITRDYVRYMNSPTILLGAEFDKVISILMVAGVLAVALLRARRSMERAIFDHAAATELARFVSAGVAETIAEAETSIKPGQAEMRSAAALFIDLRGFAALSRELPPDDVMRLLGEYQKRVIPLVRQHDGSIDKFLGDGILASFGAVAPSATYAADALRAADSIVDELTRWQIERRTAGLATPAIGIALASGDVLFGAVGDETRLEYTIIGDAVNTAAKLEKHTKAEQVTTLTTLATFELGASQGYSTAFPREIRGQRRILGVGAPMDIVVLAR
ncbi:MAG: adenylate/guanylate cyclase domain-containing protein [Rhodospirillales bacterium]|nr:adenylate/guanylate cyclase domain-containing protein [Rhodospirillales bacterium]